MRLSILIYFLIIIFSFSSCEKEIYIEPEISTGNADNNSNGNGNSNDNNNNPDTSNNENSNGNKEEPKSTSLKFTVKYHGYASNNTSSGIIDEYISDFNVCIYQNEWEIKQNKYWSKQTTNYYGITLFENLPTENGIIHYKVYGYYSPSSMMSKKYYERISSAQISKGNANSINVTFDRIPN